MMRDDHQMFFYSKKPKNDKEIAKPNGVIMLDDILSVFSGGEDDGKIWSFVFTIQTHSRTYKLAAEYSGFRSKNKKTFPNRSTLLIPSFLPR